MTDIVFVHPHPIDAYRGLESLAAIEPPLWPRMMAAHARARGYSVEIFDMQLSDGLVEFLNEKMPVLTVIYVQGANPSSSTQTMPAATAACKLIKRSADVPLLVAGVHPAALPQRTLEETGADFVCTGEGPETVEALVDHIKKVGSKWKYASKAKVPGLAYWDHDDVQRTGGSINTADVALLTGMWEVIDPKKYRSHNWHAWTNSKQERQPYAAIYTSLGCPFSCGFCQIQTPFHESDQAKLKGKANSYRLWPVESVVSEIAQLYEMDVRNIKIADEMFCLNRAHVAGICQALIKTGLNEGLNIWAYARVDTVMSDLLPLMREAGIRWLCLGIESASGSARDGVDKDDYDYADIVRTCARLKEHDVCLIANFIFGLPDDDNLSMKNTLSLATEIKPEYANFYSCMALPGSALYDQADKENLPKSWSGYAQLGYETYPMATESLTARDVLWFRDHAFESFFSDPSYLRMVLRKFGPKAHSEVKNMLKIKLERRLLEHDESEE